MCLMISINAMITDEYCGDINHIFLGLCESDNSLLGIAEIDRLISGVLSARGFRNSNGDLSVLVTLEFNLCFESVAVTAQFNQTKYLLDIAGENKLCHTQGLACLSHTQGLVC